jgi:AmmeMemoRadiSam system protein B
MPLKVAELAGRWYPGSERDLKTACEQFSKQAQPTQLDSPLAAIVPHAGWAFSGSLAFNALSCLADSKADTVVLFGGHKGPSSPLTIFADQGFETPAGPLSTDIELVEHVGAAWPTIVFESASNNTQDNAVEVVLPLIQVLFSDCRIVVVGAPPNEKSSQLADAIVDAAGALGRKILLVGSTDLTHYGPNYGFVPQGIGPQAERWVREQNDAAFIKATLEMNPGPIVEEGLARRSACCPGAVAAAVSAAKKLGSKRGEQLRYATSADVHPSDSFVGYSALVF